MRGLVISPKILTELSKIHEPTMKLSLDDLGFITSDGSFASNGNTWKHFCFETPKKSKGVNRLFMEVSLNKASCREIVKIKIDGKTINDCPPLTEILIDYFSSCEIFPHFKMITRQGQLFFLGIDESVVLCGEPNKLYLDDLLKNMNIRFSIIIVIINLMGETEIKKKIYVTKENDGQRDYWDYQFFYFFWTQRKIFYDRLTGHYVYLK